MPRITDRNGVLAMALCAAWLAGCTTTGLQEAPILDRSERRGGAPAPATASVPVPREAKDGVYVVQRGDTLYSIALEFSQDYRDLARWNGMDDPARLQLGQSLRVVPPADAAGAVAAMPIAPPPPVEARPLDLPGSGGPAPLPPVGGPGAVPQAAPGPSPVPGAAAGGPSGTAATAPVPSASKAPAVDTPAAWAWPASGRVIGNFSETRNKGIDIAGKEGEPVVAAADGQVVYSGNGLRGYGNLIILKHSDDYVSAYAHNKQIAVKQGQAVKRGQRIAELGRSDADVPKLHFEIRRQGKPVDPLKYLPTR